MNRAAKILITLNGLLATAALNPAVQGAVAGFVVHHPFLTVLGASLSSIGHLLTEPITRRELPPTISPLHE